MCVCIRCAREQRAALFSQAGRCLSPGRRRRRQTVPRGEAPVCLKTARQTSRRRTNLTLADFVGPSVGPSVARRRARSRDFRVPEPSSSSTFVVRVCALLYLYTHKHTKKAQTHSQQCKYVTTRRVDGRNVRAAHFMHRCRVSGANGEASVSVTNARQGTRGVCRVENGSECAWFGNCFR